MLLVNWIILLQLVFFCNREDFLCFERTAKKIEYICKPIANRLHR